MAAMWSLVILTCSNSAIWLPECLPIIGRISAQKMFPHLKILYQRSFSSLFPHNVLHLLSFIPQIQPFHIFFFELGIPKFYDRTIANSSPAINSHPDQHSIHSHRSNSHSHSNNLTRLRLACIELTPQPRALDIHQIVQLGAGGYISGHTG